MSDQLSLFGDTAPLVAPETRAADAALDARRTAAAAIAARLPDSVYFGTSSWTFPGWAGLVYPAGLSATALGREGLRHYARHPLLRTVGVDRSYYAPIPLDDLRAYADQLPDGFRCCLKAPATVTSRIEPSFGAARGAARPNPDFLSVGRLVDDLLAPLASGFARHPDRSCSSSRRVRATTRWPRLGSPRRSIASSRRCPATSTTRSSSATGPC